MPGSPFGGRGVGWFVALVAAVGLVAGCGDDDDDTTATESPPGASAAVATAAGSEGATVTVPADLLADGTPLPTGAALRSASGSAPGPWVLVYAVDGDVARAVTDYRDQLTAAGYELQDAAAVGELVSSFDAVGQGHRVTAIGSGVGDGAGMIVTVTAAP